MVAVATRLRIGEVARYTRVRLTTGEVAALAKLRIR
jgi:hypothetical protein